MRGFHLLAIAAAIVAATPAISRAPNDGPAIIAAGKQIQARLKTAPRGAAPALTNGGATLVRTAFDAAGIRAHPLTLEIGDICVAVGNTIVAYTEYTVRVTAGEANPTAASDKLLNDSYQDEMTLGAVAANVCIQRGFRAVAIALAAMSAAQRAGTIEPLRQMRDGAVATVEGTMAQATLPGIKPGNAAAMLDSILEDAPALAASLLGPDRSRLRQRALDHAAKASPALAKRLNAIARAFSGSQCDILCKTAGG